MGITSLNQKLNDPDLKEYFTGIFPRDHPGNSRFAVNFFFSIGLNPLTQSLRKFLFEEVDKQKSHMLALQNTEQLLSPEQPKESSESQSDSESLKPQQQNHLGEQHAIADQVKQEVHPHTLQQIKTIQPNPNVHELRGQEEGRGFIQNSKDLLRNTSKNKKKKHNRGRKTKKISKKTKKLRKKTKISHQSLELSSGSSLSDA